MYCLERGGDPNLPTTDASKTIYHIALVAPTIDDRVLQRFGKTMFFYALLGKWV